MSKLPQNFSETKVQKVGQMNCYDKNGKELKIGQMVFTWGQQLGVIIDFNDENDTRYFYVKYFNEKDAPNNIHVHLAIYLQAVTPEKATLLKLESFI